MDPISLEEFFSSPDVDGSPGSQLYLYRYLHLLAARESHRPDSAALFYSGAKKLAARLQLHTAERLEQLFRNAGLGQLHLETGMDRLRVIVEHHRPFPGSTTPVSREEFRASAGSFTSGAGNCHLERGLIDGALESITGLGVTTLETSCWTKGAEACVFEACRDLAQGFRGQMVDERVSGRAYAGDERGRLDLNPQGNIYGSSASYGRHLPGLPTAGSPVLRSWYLDLASREVIRAKRHGRELSLLYIDLDDLGEVNQNRGRAAGDQIISSVASALSRSCRSEDFLWHHGEDEFAVLLAETGPGSAEAAAHRLISQIRAAAEYVDFSVRVSASIGYATFPTHADDIAGLFSSARSALYLAKSIGKGKVQIARQGMAKDAANPPLSSHKRPVAERQGSRRSTGDDEESGAAAEEAIAVVISSSSPLLLAGMEQILNQSEAIEIIGSIMDPAQLILTVSDLRPDLVFVDVGIAMANEHALLRTLENENLPCKMVISAVHVDQDAIKLAADFRIDGIILQNSSSSEVLKAFLSIYQGRSVLPDEVKAAISDLQKSRRLLNELSERELEVLKLVAEGKSNSQISDELFITVNTVRFHLANIYQKLMVANRTEAANYYLRQDMAQENQPRFFE